MYYDKDYGICTPELNWVPSPQYLLRRQRVLHYFKDLPPRELLEIGCGAGGLLVDLARQGHHCTAVEYSSEAREVAAKITSKEVNIKILAEPENDFTGRYDYVVACEVLEHIEHDTEALAEWVSYLKPGGRLVLSVPGHPDKWDATDEWAGHYRRYTRPGLESLLKSHGLHDITVECYAFPFTNIIAPIRAMILEGQRKRAKAKHETADRESQTKASGISRSLHCKLFPLQSSLPGRWTMHALYSLQTRYLDRDIGLCYLTHGIKSG